MKIGISSSKYVFVEFYFRTAFASSYHPRTWISEYEGQITPSKGVRDATFFRNQVTDPNSVTSSKSITSPNSITGPVSVIETGCGILFRNISGFFWILWDFLSSVDKVE